MDSNKFELIRQSLSAAESSIRLAKQLLSELESGDSHGRVNTKPNGVDLPGISGIFDGENMISESGEVFPVPANYASKSMLVVGDTLKLVEEGKNKEKRFKQIEHVKRHKSTGILTKKDGKWKVVTPEGSYKVLGSAVEHFGADIGTEVTLHLPATNLTVAYGAIESIKGAEKKEPEKPVESDKPQQLIVEQKEQPKQPEPRKEEKPKEVVHISKEVKKEPEKPKHEPKPAVKQQAPEPKKEVVTVPVAKVEKEVVEKIVATPPVPVPAPKPMVVVAPEVPEPSKPAAVSTVQPTTPEKSMEVASEEEELT